MTMNGRLAGYHHCLPKRRQAVLPLAGEGIWSAKDYDTVVLINDNDNDNVSSLGFSSSNYYHDSEDDT
jgi:hypothetical protein